MIPACVKLEQRQIDLLNQWFPKIRARWERDNKEELDYDSCECSSFVTFEITASGIGDSIIAKALGWQIDLSIDDDNELVAHYDNWFNKFMEKI